MQRADVFRKHCVRRIGESKAQKIILMHSLAAHAEMWWPQLEALSERYEVVTYDFPGHGGSAAPERGQASMDGFTKDLLEVVDSITDQSVILLGLSLGGMVAQRFAAKHSSRVSKLILADTDFYTPPDNPWSERIEIVKTKGVESIVEGTIERWFSGEFMLSHANECDRVRHIIRGTSVAGYVHAAEAIKALDNRELLGRIDAPTLVLVGADDPSTPASRARELASLIPRSEFCEIRGGKHLPNIERGEEFNELVCQFLLD